MVYRACASSYVVFTAVLGLPLGVCIVALAIRGDPSLGPVVAAGAAALLLAYRWLGRFRLEFSADAVAYAGLFTRKRAVARTEIVSAAFAERTGPFESPMTFVIRTRGGAEIRVNAKVFSPEAVRSLAALDPSAGAVPHLSRAMVPPNQTLQPTGHAKDGSSDFSASSRVSRRLSGVVRRRSRRARGGVRARPDRRDARPASTAAGERHDPRRRSIDRAAAVSGSRHRGVLPGPRWGD